MKVRNPKYVRPDNKAIDLEIEHATFGWIPTTAAPDDVEPLGRALYAAAVAGNYGPVAPYVAPPSPTPQVPRAVTMRQARLALLQAGLLDKVVRAIEAIPDATARQAAQIEWEYSAEVHRDRAWVQQLSAALGLSAVQLDQLVVTAAKL